MSKTSNSPMASRVLNSTTVLKGFDATEIRKLNLDEIDSVAGGGKTTSVHESLSLPFTRIEFSYQPTGA